MATAHLATLVAVFKDGSRPIVSRQAVQPLELPQYASGYIWVECLNEDGEGHSLTYDTLLWGVRFRPTDSAPSIELQFTNMDTDPDGNPADNWARAELVPGHWVGVVPRIYGHEVVALIGGNPDDRAVGVPYSQLKVTGAAVHPGDEVSVPESQEPLAQGPQGEQGPIGSLPAKPSYKAVLACVDGQEVWQQKSRVKATFNGSSAQVAVTWESFEDREYAVDHGGAVTSEAEYVGIQLLNVTATGCTVQATAPFVGFVWVEIEEVL